MSCKALTILLSVVASASGAADKQVTVDLVVEGTLADFPASRLAEIGAPLASIFQLDADVVVITAEAVANGVDLHVVVGPIDEAMATQVSGTLTPYMSSAATATTALPIIGITGLTVLNTPVVATADYTAPSGGGGGSDPCFPSAATVTKADGTIVRVASLKEGDEIVATDEHGSLTTDTVSQLSIAKHEVEADFVVLTTAVNATLTLTDGHHMPVGPACCSVLKHAKDVTVSETVWGVVAGKAVATTVTSKAATRASGLHSPVLTHGGFPVVNGLVTAFDSIDKVILAKHGLAPLLAACKATGTCGKLKSIISDL